MRICSRCGEEKPIEEFPEQKLGTGRRHGHCRSCKARYQAAWYAKNRERHKANVNEIRRVRVRMHQQLVRAAKDQPCSDCGVRYPPYVMDLDHVRGEKVGAIAELVSTVTTAVLLSEIARSATWCARTAIGSGPSATPTPGGIAGPSRGPRHHRPRSPTPTLLWGSCDWPSSDARATS